MAASLPEVSSLPYPTLVDGCRHPPGVATKPRGAANSISPLRQDLSIQLFSPITANVAYNPH